MLRVISGQHRCGTAKNNIVANLEGKMAKGQWAVVKISDDITEVGRFSGDAAERGGAMPVLADGSDVGRKAGTNL